MRGRILPSRGFVSVSEDPSYAYTFIRSKKGVASDPNSLGVMYQVVLPQGSPALPLYGHRDSLGDNIGSAPMEQEIVLPRNTGFRVIDYKVRTPPSGFGRDYLFLLVEPVFSESPAFRSRSTP